MYKQGLKDISYILDDTAPGPIKLEARDLLTSRVLINSEIKKYQKAKAEVPAELQEQFHQNTQRLFELFIQTEDMRKFSYDFADLEATLGPAATNPEDITRWNSFYIDNEFVEFDAALKKFQPEPDITRKPAPKIVRKSKLGRGDQDIDFYSDSENTIVDEEAEQALFGQEIQDLPEEDSEKKEVATELMKDHDGHLWHTVIVHDDTTQNVTSEERVMSYRVLIVIGNLRGAGGYGMGKGTTARLALNSAFR